MHSRPLILLILALGFLARPGYAETDRLTDLAIRKAEEAKRERGVPEDSARLNAMRQVAMASLMYAVDHKGRLPERPKDLEGYLEADILQLVRHGQLRLMGQGLLPAGKDAAVTVIVEEKEPGPDGRRYAAYADGRVADVSPPP